MTYIKLIINILKVALLACLFLVALMVLDFLHSYTARGIDLVKMGNWPHVAGSVIVHQDGSAGQPNPPVNISGGHLSVNGDFSITATFSKIDKQASLRLYSAVPIVYDQWRYESPSVEVAIDAVKNIVTARVWDGSSSNSMDERTFDIPGAPSMTVSLQHIKNQIVISQNNHVLGNMPDHNIFSSGQVWFGVDGNYTLAALYAKGNVKVVPALQMSADQTDKTSLRNLAEANGRHINIGATVSVNPLFTNQQYKNLALSQFSMWTPENALKPQFIHPSPTVYDFTESDLLVDAALKNNIAVHGHVLVYEKSSPDWMTKSAVADRQQIMTDHIQNVVGHFKGRVAEWDVINEPFSDKQAAYKNGGSGLDKNMWFEAMSETYIDLAFKTAHQADPSAKLYLNDYALEHDGTHWDALVALVKRLQARGVPIDGIGFEAHVYTDDQYFDASQFASHMKILRGLGLLTRISEIDVTGDDASQQVKQYVIALDVCLKAPNCTSYTTWGISDAYGSTTRSDRYPLICGTSLLWDKDFKPKAALGALQERLRQ